MTGGQMSKEKEYRQELLGWKWEQLRLRKKYCQTPAGFFSSEMEKQAVHQWKQEVAEFRESHRHVLESAEIALDEPFAGREAELKLIREHLENQPLPVVLYGIGGIGKSALAREYIWRYQKSYQHVLYLSFRTTIEELILDDFHIPISNLHYDVNKYESKRKYFLVKYNILQKIAGNAKILFVIDNCNVRQDRDLPRLFSLPCHILVTSRRTPVIWGACLGIHIKELSLQEDWNDFIRCYQPDGITPEERKQIEDYRKKIQGHTLLMQQKLLHPEGDFSGVAEFKKDLFRKIPLSREERQAMLYLSIMPVQGIPKELFLTVSEISEQTINHLRDISLIQWGYSGKWQDKMLFLHPIIAWAAQDIFQPSTVNCRRLIRGFGAYLNGNGNDENCTWGRTWLENQRLEPYVFAFIKAFPKPAPWLAEAFDELITFLWIQGYYQEAERYSKMLFACVKEYYGENHQITGQMALRLGAIYHNRQAYEKSKPWYVQGLHILETCKPFNQVHLLHLVSAYHKMARFLWHRGDLTHAKEHIENALKALEIFRTGLTEEQKDLLLMHDRSRAYVLLEKGRILLQAGDLSAAEQICRQLFRECTQVLRTRFRINEFINFYIKILIEKKEYQKALKNAGQNVKRALFYRGREFKDTLHSKKQYADILFLMGRTAEAQKIYEEIVEDYPLCSILENSHIHGYAKIDPGNL